MWWLLNPFCRQRQILETLWQKYYFSILRLVFCSSHVIENSLNAGIYVIAYEFKIIYFI